MKCKQRNHLIKKKVRCLFHLLASQSDLDVLSSIVAPLRASGAGGHLTGGCLPVGVGTQLSESTLFSSQSGGALLSPKAGGPSVSPVWLTV